jgi:hypothetical protein
MNEMNQSFLREYSSDFAVMKYSKKTAGLGINFILESEYGPIYLKSVREQLQAPVENGIRMLEFGCGAGMNLIYCMGLFNRNGIPIEQAYGTDFSERLITEARSELRALPSSLRVRVGFSVARNETIGTDLATTLNVRAEKVRRSFHFIFGVNTFRYPYRLGKGENCARGIYELLMPGGVCVVIDMNNKFPMFRTRLRDKATRPAGECYLPTLKEYAQPFASAGFEILENRNFCWVPHSAGRGLLVLTRAVSPVLTSLVPSFAMRSLVVCRRPL